MNFIVVITRAVGRFLAALVSLNPIRLSVGGYRTADHFEYYFQAGAPA